MASKNFEGMNTGRAYNPKKETPGARQTKATSTDTPAPAGTLHLKTEKTGGGTVYAEIAQATSKKGQQGKASPQEQAERQAEGRTQGRKGCKATRINMAFTTENHDFIKVMSKATGRTMTERCNAIITAYRTEHPEFMEKAAGFLDFVNSGAFSAKE